MKKTIKKILMAMCLIAMTATAAACGNNNAASSSSPSASSSGVQQTVFNERATEKGTEATEKGTEKATEKKSGTGSGSSKSDKDKKSKSSKSDKDKKNSSSKSDKKNNENKSNNNSSGNGGEITYYYTTTTTGGSNSSAPNQNSSSGSNGSSKNNNSGSTGKSNNSSSSQADPHAGKTWHEAVYETINHPAVTEEVWVIDQPATTREEPVYDGTKGVAICNTCGADITNCISEHGYNHMINGENASYHVEERRVQTGTKTVTIPEKKHKETKIIKPAWTEKRLVREAGWY